MEEVHLFFQRHAPFSQFIYFFIPELSFIDLNLLDSPEAFEFGAEYLVVEFSSWCRIFFLYEFNFTLRIADSFNSCVGIYTYFSDCNFTLIYPQYMALTIAHASAWNTEQWFSRCVGFSLPAQPLLLIPVCC